MPIEEKDEGQDVGTFEDFFAEAVAVEDDGESTPDNEGADNQEGADGEAEQDQTPATPENTQDSQVDQGQADYKALYEQELQRTKSWDGRLSAKDRELRALQEELERTKALAAQKSAEPNDAASEEVVKSFLEEFPELATPIQKMIEKATKQHGQAVANDITTKIESRIAPIAETVQDVTLQKHLGTIRAAHNDLETIVQSGDLQTWINEQPNYLKPALQEVYERGYAEDVVDLLHQYKRSRNIAASSGSNGQVNEQKHTTTKRPPAAVKSKHSTPLTRNEKIAEDDFDSAWAAALRTK